MTFRWCVFICALLLCSTLQVNAAKYRGGGHSYPKSGGLSGGHSSHSYPTSHGLSGNSRPQSGQAHAYPSSSGQNHAYPSSSGQSHGYPSSGGSHGYPSSGGLSGNRPSRPGAAGSSHFSTHTTNNYNNYHYSPPQQIRYTPPHGGAPVSYPVYHGPPPTYVYQYKDSGSKYGTLLAGLALLNLGTLAGAAYIGSQHGHGSSGSYKASPGEVCKFGVKKDNGDYDETRIDCQLISSFIMQEQMKSQNGGGGTNTTSVVTTTVTNVTMANGSNSPSEATPTVAPATAAVGNVVYTMLPNGTLVPLNGTLVNGTFVPGGASENVTSAASPEAAGNSMSSSVTTTTTNTTTVVNALDVKGAPVTVTPGMVCYVVRTTPTSNMKKSVPCGVLQSYATQSLKKNSAARNVPIYTALTVVIAMVLTY